MVYTIPKPPPQPRLMALDLLDELEIISSQSVTRAAVLCGLPLDPTVLEQLQPGVDARTQRIICHLETAAEILRRVSDPAN